ncbi:MAG: Mut7-C RNAse domain-containing protein [Halodesulfurarchaeum sp.]
MYAPGRTSLLLDVMLGGLLSPLRMMGYDTAYALERGVEADEAVLGLATSEGRVLLTRDVAVAERAREGILIETTDPQAQLCELADVGFELVLGEPTRCSRCNGRLDRCETGPGPENGPDPSSQAIWQCRSCEQFYWKGSHWEDLARRLEEC